MPSQLSQEDKMLLGEVDLNGDAVLSEDMDSDAHSSNGLDENGSNSLIAMAGELVPVDRSGNKVNDAKGVRSGASAAPSKATTKKRGALVTAENSSDETTLASGGSPTKKAKTKLNGSADVEDPKTPSPKKRASPKKKASGPMIKTEAHEDNPEMAAEPTTPSPTKKRSSAKKAVNRDGEESVSPIKAGDSTARNTPRQRAAPAKAMATPRGIPTSWDTADEADRMMVTMKEKGEDWAAIREAWTQATGQSTANSTLPNRYARIKVNMMHLNDGDKLKQAIHLLAAKKETEAEMWAYVATKMEAKGCDKYATAFLQKQFKALEDQAASAKLSVEAYIENIAAKKEEEEEEEEEAEPVRHAIDAFVKDEGDATNSE